MTDNSSPRTGGSAGSGGRDSKAPITIKKYANRRLYNTATSCYVTLDHLCQMVKEGVDFVVYDAKSGDDITRSVLTQIIVEEENKGQNLLPISFLRQLISFYGDNMQWMVPSYLEHTMKSFAQNQDNMRHMLQDTFGSMFPFGNLEEMGKQQMAMFDQAMRMFSPFPIDNEGTRSAARTAKPAASSNGSASAGGPSAESLKDLTSKIETLQSQLETLHKMQQQSQAPQDSPPKPGSLDSEGKEG